MLREMILGLLRDGAPRHGYGLRQEYRFRAGVGTLSRHFYSELHELAADGLIRGVPNPPGSDPRRRLYTITRRGSAVFDAWLGECEGTFTERRDDGMFAKALFLGVAEPKTVHAVLDAWLDAARQRDDVVRRARDAAERRPKKPLLDPLALLLERQVRTVAADLEFIDSFRAAYDRFVGARGTVSAFRA